MNIDELKVRKGESVRMAWDRLVRWVESLKIIPNDDVTMRFSRHGTVVRSNRSKKYMHPFRVSASNGSARVSPGILNHLFPVIKSKDGSIRRIDNRDKDGKKQIFAPPELPLNFKDASEDGRIYISIRWKPAAKDSDQIPPEIVPCKTPSGPQDGFGYCPLGLLFLTEDKSSVERVFQIVHHNLNASYQERSPDRFDLISNPDAIPIGRYVFFPV